MGRPAFDWVGRRTGRLLVLKRANEVGEKPVYLVRCDCGTEREMSSSQLRGGTVSCGCRKREGTRTAHGHAGGDRSKEYRSWLSMRNRCGNPASGSYERYGAKGIKVCPEWATSFDAFLSDIGEMPKDGVRYTIDRIDPSRGYEPGNCRWATMKDQARSQTKTVLDEEKVRFIKAHPEIGPTALALKFQCSTGAIVSVRAGRTWREVK